jgi:hypothetical protein
MNTLVWFQTEMDRFDMPFQLNLGLNPFLLVCSPGRIYLPDFGIFTTSCTWGH